MAKYQKYAEYKDSGEDFLPILPSSWEVSRVKKLMTLQRSIVGNKSSSYQLLSLTLKGVIPRDISNGDGKIPESFDTYQVVKADDLVCCLFDMDETPRTIGIAEQKGMITGAYNVYTVKQDNFPRYIYYYFLYLDYFKGLKPYYTGLRKVVRADTFANIKMPCPSFFEQIKIANFLDYETAQIDTLIAKQEKLIELLKEKRQAVISHAVTKGLNPDVNMKDSGVEWLGQVPEHWKVMQFRRITSLSQGLQIPQSERLHEPNDNTVEYITIKSLNAKDDAYKEYIYKASDRVTCGKSDVLLARTGATGEVVTNVSGAFHNNFFKVSYSNDILRDFLVYILKVKELKSHLLMLAGTTTIPDLNHGAFLGTQIALPSLTEQQEIIDFIDDYLRRSMILEGKARLAIQLMQERRTALISSAVTGKIDVRNWRHPNEAKTEFGA